MHRYGNLWAKICSADNLESAADATLKGVAINAKLMQKVLKAESNGGGLSKYADTAEYFFSHRTKMLAKLRKDLLRRTFEFGPMMQITVHEPKERRIDYPKRFIDRVAHTALLQVIDPLIISRLTHNTYGSIKGRGIKMAATRFRRFLDANPDCYLVYTDAAKYYQSIDHGILKSKLARVFKDDGVLWLCGKIIDAHAEGLAIGVGPSQTFANFYHSEIDHMIMERWGAIFHVRYMDDNLIAVKDKASARLMLERMRQAYAEHGLRLKATSRYFPAKVGADFIGYKFLTTHTRLRKRIKLAFKRRVSQLLKSNANDELFKRKTASYFGWCKHCAGRHLVKKTLGHKFYLYAKNMNKYQTLSEKRGDKYYFGLPPEKRVSINSLFGVGIVVFDFQSVTLRGEPKIAVKFAYPDNDEDMRYFITRSDVLSERLDRDKEMFPCVIKLLKKKRYFAYE